MLPLQNICWDSVSHNFYICSFCHTTAIWFVGWVYKLMRLQFVCSISEVGRYAFDTYCKQAEAQVSRSLLKMNFLSQKWHFNQVQYLHCVSSAEYLTSCKIFVSPRSSKHFLKCCFTERLSAKLLSHKLQQYGLMSECTIWWRFNTSAL